MNPDEKDEKHPVEQTGRPIKSLRTYQGDVEEAISKNKFSSTDIFLAEQEKKRTASDLKRIMVFNNPETKNKILFTIGLVLVTLGLVAIGVVYYLRSNESVIVEQKTKAIIGFTKEKTLLVSATTREKFTNQILAEKNGFSLPVNSVLYLNTVDANEKPAEIENVLTLLAPKMPGSLSRSFENKYMLGVFSFDTNEFFIILTTEDFGLSFSGMLKWEKDMLSDIGKLFAVLTNASSTSLTFVDQERRNKDLRVLKGENGKILLLYSFIDSKTLLITKNESVFNAILNKYQVSQQAK